MVQQPGEVVVSSCEYQQGQFEEFEHPPRDDEVELDSGGGTLEQVVLVYPVVAEEDYNNSGDADRVDVGVE